MIKLFTLIFSVLILSVPLQAQEVRGTVTDENQEPIPGVSIVVEGTTTGTITDINGYYSLKPGTNSFTLLYKYIGFTDYTQEFTLAEAEIDISIECNRTSGSIMRG